MFFVTEILSYKSSQVFVLLPSVTDFLFTFVRRNKKQLLRSISEGAVGFHSTLHKNQYNVCHDRTRNLIRLSNRHSNSCSSGISSTGMTEQTHLSSLQMGVDTIAIDSDHYDEADDDGMLTML